MVVARSRVRHTNAGSRVLYHLRCNMEQETPLIRELDECFRIDPDIDELGIIFNIPPPSSGGISEATVATASLEGTRSEPHFIVQEHKLGISVHSVHPLINEARGAFFSARKDYLRARDVVFGGTSAIICTPDINVCESADAELSLATATSRLMSVTRALLLVNADHGSAWNARKKVIQHGKCGSVLEEIKLLDLIFTKHAKSPNAWAHRRWCWRNDKRIGLALGSLWQPLTVQSELQVCRQVAELYPKNYYAWTQRSWVVLREVGLVAGGDQQNAAAMNQAEALLESELFFVDEWLTKHVSDHSALNHRKNIASALAASSSGAKFIERERSSNSVVIKDYPGHESLWCYRRFICQAFLVTTPPHSLFPAPAVVTEGICNDSKDGDTFDARNRNREVDEVKALPDDLRMLNAWDWTGWNRAVRDLHHVLVEEDAREPTDYESGGRYDPDDDDDDELNAEGGDGTDDVLGELPAGSLLMDFLSGEVRFALECATDKGVWLFRQQRRHALSYLAFISYAAVRIFRLIQRGCVETTGSDSTSGTGEDKCGDGNVNAGIGMPFSGSKTSQKEIVRSSRPGDSAEFSNVSEMDKRRAHARQPVPVGAGITNITTTECTSYCEVTGALKVVFPLALDGDERETQPAHDAGPIQQQEAPGMSGSRCSGCHEDRPEAGNVGNHPYSHELRSASYAAIEGLRSLNAHALRSLADCNGEGMSAKSNSSENSTANKMGGIIVPYII